LIEQQAFENKIFSQLEVEKEICQMAGLKTYMYEKISAD
jgi:hypothetical protein